MIWTKTFAVCLAAFLPAVTWAGEYTWTGGGSDDNWTSPANWGAVDFPQNSTDNACFDGSAPRQPTVNNNVDVLNLNVTGTKNWTWSGSSAVTLYEAFNYGSSGTGAFNAVIGGTGMVVVTAGRLNLGNANTYSGNTIIKGGTVYLNAANRISAGDIVILDTSGANSATFWAAYANQTFARNFIINAGSDGTASLIMNQGNESCTFSGTFALGKDIYVTATSTRDRILFTGVISGNGGLIKLGTGTASLLALCNVGNTYKGKTTIQEGELVVSSEGAMGTPDPGNEAIIITGSGVLGNNDVSLTLTRPILVSSAVAGTSRIGQFGGTYDTITLQGDITLEKDLTIGANNSGKPLILNISEVAPGTRTITGAGGLVHFSSGTTTYSRKTAPDFQGGLTVQAGVVKWSPSGGITGTNSFGGGSIVLAGGSFTFDAAPNQEWMVTNGLNGNGTVTVESGANTLTVVGRTVAPGSTGVVDTLNINGSLAFGKEGSSNSMLIVRLRKPAESVTNNLLAVTRNLSGLSNATLSVDVEEVIAGPEMEGQEYIIATCTNNLTGQAFGQQLWSETTNPSGRWKGTVEYGDGFIKLKNMYVATSGTILTVR